MTSEERSWLLISRAVSGDISPEEEKELESFFLDQPGLRSDFENIKKLKLTPPLAVTTAERRAMDRGLEKLNHSLSDEQRFMERHLFSHRQLSPLSRKSPVKWMVAASMLVLLFASFYAYRHRKISESLPQQELVTHNGTRTHTTLPDGSTVWLNAGSSIKYAADLITNGKREVTLNGEAYFDIKHDAQHPFIVHAGKLNVVVLGTAFNIKAYKGDSFVETTLLRGKVEILNEGQPGSPIILYPNEKVSVSTNNTNLVAKTLVTLKKPVSDSLTVATQAPALPDEAITETAWINDKLTFKKENFAELAKQLNRWYDVQIIFDNNLYQAREFTGTFKDQHIDEVMRALQLTESFHYTITNNQIHIW